MSTRSDDRDDSLSDYRECRDCGAIYAPDPRRDDQPGLCPICVDDALDDDDDDDDDDDPGGEVI